MYNKYDLEEIIRVGISLAKTNFRLRIEGSYLGILWYLLNPLVLFLVLYFVKETAFSEISIPFFPLYLLIGISGFNFFKQAITGSIDVINTNPEYLKSINKINPESLVIAIVLQSVFSHLFELALIIALAIYLQVSLVGFIFYPIIFGLFVLLTLGISFIFATIGVFISDLNNVWSIISQLLFLATPIFYNIGPASLIYKVNLLNPLFYFLEISRDLIIYHRLPSLFLIITMTIASFLFLFIGIFIFRQYKKKFAELL